MPAAVVTAIRSECARMNGCAKHIGLTRHILNLGARAYFADLSREVFWVVFPLDRV